MSISEFSRICDISRKTLIYYDRIGLFKPALVKPNGYRCYAHWQIETITVISTLSGLGVSLDKIKQYIQQYEPEQALQMLNEQNEALERKMEALHATQEMIRMRIRLIKEGMTAGAEPRVVEQEKTPLYTSAPFHCDTNEIPDEHWVRFYTTCEQNGISFCYPICYIVTCEDLLAGNYHMVSHLCFRMENMRKANNSMPAGRYLVGYGNYHYGDTFALYEHLCRYAVQHQLEIGGNAYEEYLLDELTTSHIDAYLVKLSIQLK